VNLARRRGKVLKVVGSAHSPSDIHLSSEWMMSLDNLNSVISHDLDNRTITIQAGMRLFQYLKELEKRGWSIDNLGSISEQSMAGVISTCTHGSSLSHGVISTQVLDPLPQYVVLMVGGGYYVGFGRWKYYDLLNVA
jgi:FAD/FMN-containing dehydrogenase